MRLCLAAFGNYATNFRGPGRQTQPCPPHVFVASPKVKHRSICILPIDLLRTRPGSKQLSASLPIVPADPGRPRAYTQCICFSRGPTSCATVPVLLAQEPDENNIRMHVCLGCIATIESDKRFIPLVLLLWCLQCGPGAAGTRLADLPNL